MEDNNKEIVFVCQVYYPDESSTSQLFQPMMERMVADGYKVSVICGYSGSTKSSNHEVINGVEIFRNGLNINHKKGFFWRLIAYASFIISVFFRLILMRSGPRFIGVTNPPFNAHILYICSKIRNRNYDYIFLDLHPEGLVRTSVLKDSSIINKFWLKLNKIAYRYAQNIYVIGRDMKCLIHEQYGIDINKITYMPHWSVNENNKYIKFKDSVYTNKLDLTDKFVIQYSGNMGLWHDINTFVKAAYLLRDYKNICFVFVGDGIKKSEAMDLSKKLGCKNIIWKDFVPQEDLHESLSACHVSLITLAKGLEGIAVPCKLYGILASGRAVLSAAPEESEIALTVSEHNCGINVLPGDVDSIVDSIINLSNDKDEVRMMGLRGLDACKSIYTLENAINILKGYQKESNGKQYFKS